jgi:hypothetical protein
MLPQNQKLVDDFFAAIAPVEQAYKHIGLSYLAVKSGGHFTILIGRVFLNTKDPETLRPHFASANVRAGHYNLKELKLDARGLADKLIEGKLNTPHGELVFRSAVDARCAASFVPFHPEGLKSQRRINVLTLMAGPVNRIPQPDTDWEIRAASLPYAGVQELANDFGLGGVAEGSIEFVAPNVAVIDGQRSKLSGTDAEIHVLLSEGLSQDKLTLGYGIYVPGKVTKRAVVSGEKMRWTKESDLLRGQTEFQAENTAVLNCTVSYDGIAQSHLWVSDPDKVQNSRRAVYEAFDPKLENLKGILAAAQGRGQEARELESVVAWLLWMLGFSVAQLGGTRRTRDAADLIVTTPEGHFAVIECTTGLLKAENKLSLLHDRTEAVRRSLGTTNNTYQRVLPVMVTSKMMSEIKPDVEAAERLGISIVAREQLESAINRTLIQPNADQIYAEAEQAMNAALAKYQG